MMSSFQYNNMPIKYLKTKPNDGSQIEVEQLEPWRRYIIMIEINQKAEQSNVEKEDEEEEEEEGERKYVCKL